MSVSGLLQPATESQTWSSLYANQLHVSSLVADGLTLDGNLDMNGNDIVNVGNYTGSGTMATGTLIVSGPMAGEIATFSGSVGISGSLSSGSISSSGTITASGQSFICYSNPFASSQSIANSSRTTVTFLTTATVNKGSDITWNPGSGTLVFHTNGYYTVNVQLSWAAFSSNPANNVNFQLLDLTGPYISSQMSILQNGQPRLSGSISKFFSSGQTLTLSVLQDSSASQTLGSGNVDSFICAYRVVS